MRTVTTADLTALLGRHDPPCVSIYLPLATAYPDTQQDRIRYRNLVDEAEAGARGHLAPAQAAPLLQKFRELAADDAFWAHRRSGLAVLGSPDAFHVFELNRPVPQRCVVANSFHVKPLLRVVQSADRFHILCLQREEVRLFEGNRDGLTPIRPAGIPWTVTEALGGESSIQSKNQAPAPKNEDQKGKSGEATRRNPRGAQPGPGHAAKGDDAKLDAERFFRAVDRAVWEHVSRDSRMPLVVAALPEHQAMFRAVTHNPRVVAQGIERNPGSMSVEHLREAAWKCVEPDYVARLQKHIEDFNTARARQQASADLSAIAKAAQEGRVGILLVEAERVIPGRLDPNTGDALQAAEDARDVDDLLDDVAEAVLRTKGTVVVVPRDRMPTETGLAATNRF
jgi:hypothetical protein